MWKKINKNKLGLLGLVFIIGLTAVSLLGYLIIPDSSTNANDIHLEIALQKPGFFSRLFINSSASKRAIKFIAESLAFWFSKQAK